LIEKLFLSSKNKNLAYNVELLDFVSGQNAVLPAAPEDSQGIDLATQIDHM